ncbi:MAG: hypothetical protein FJZ00_14090, partial [Candidatus Sericytochromatia bacterium]|nr:hypothetical protein [Candidatus Tanganyikabacteria bacterium]
MFRLRLLLLAVSAFLLLAAPAWAGILRFASEGDLSRIRVMATRPRAVRALNVPGGVRWEFKVDNPGYGLERKALTRGPIREVDVYHRGLALEVTLHWRFPMPQLRPTL